MNPKNYLVKTLPTGNEFETEYYWRGVSLSLYSLLLFKDHLSFDLNALQKRYPDAPFPLYTQNFKRIGDAETCSVASRTHLFYPIASEKNSEVLGCKSPDRSDVVSPICLIKQQKYRFFYLYIISTIKT